MTALPSDGWILLDEAYKTYVADEGKPDDERGWRFAPDFRPPGMGLHRAMELCDLIESHGDMVKRETPQGWQYRVGPERIGIYQGSREKQTDPNVTVSLTQERLAHSDLISQLIAANNRANAAEERLRAALWLLHTLTAAYRPAEPPDESEA